ncbi:netrin receptor unc-5 [Stomoxys calcitrans]|uniref:netrin receptor unc-5 n=1 Tax=Stomoxys calcitrans TaxID=35570 RepID=UPI0027E30C53|nr:netrin receptor unc-5 [Stomoxys calcitrans]XP_059224909.1 netrin receptor unc-5 [Stomoxys calcitrans]
MHRKTTPRRYRILNSLITYFVICGCLTASMPSSKDSMLLADSEEDVFSKFEDVSDELDGEEDIRISKSENPKYPHWNKLVDVDGSYPDNTDVFTGGKAPLAPAFHPDESLGHSGEAASPNGNSSSSSSGVNGGGKSVIAAGTLDEIFTGKLGASETGVTPIFLNEPESVYVVKNRPAILKCKAAHALQLHFKCSGSSQPPPSTHDKHVDPHTGVHLEEVTATIHRDLVDEYFGKGPFKCECHAWSSRGVVKSQAATVNIAYMRKQFVTSPTSLRVEVGTRAELYCEPPNGFPLPTVSWYKNNVPITENKDIGPTVSATGTLTFRQVTLQDMANYTCVAENIAGKRNSDSAVLIVYVNGGWNAWSSWRECKCPGKPAQGRKRARMCNNPIPMNGGAECTGPQVQKSVDCIPCPDETQIVNTEGFDMAPAVKRTGRWSAWSEWSSCSSECIQIRRRKCQTTGSGSSILVNDDDDDEDDEDDDDDDDDDVIATGLGIKLGGLSSAGLVGGLGNSGIGSSGSSASGSSSAIGPVLGGGVGTGVGGNGKALCSGKDIQTAECRGEYCQIGKDDFDWTLYLGLAFVTAVFFAFGAALICCARKGIRVNQHYNMTRTVMDPKYLPDISKKDMRMHIETANDNYDYASPGHRFLPPSHHGGCSISEHHYDVPNLSANYVNPIDDLSVDYLTDTPDTSTVDTSNSTYEVNAKIGGASAASKCSTYDQLNCSGGSLNLYQGEIMLYIPEHSIGKSMRKHVALMLVSDETSRVSIPNSDALLVCSTIVHCSPRNYSFLKPVILKIPHCLVDTQLWNVFIYYADNDHDDLNVNWRRIIAVGEETINTPVFVQLEAEHVYIMTEQLGRFVVVAEPKLLTASMQNSLKMRLIAFSQFTPSSTNCSLRIYIVKDFPNSRDICSSIESKLGGSFMGESEAFAFYLNCSNMNIRLRSSDADMWDTEHEVELHEQIIPYNHILSNNSVLHCEFIIKRNEQLYTSNELTVDFAQCSDNHHLYSEVHSFSISRPQQQQQQHQTSNSSQHTNSHHSPHSSLERQSTVTMDPHGNYVNEATLPLTTVHLPRDTKRRICAALDPPREDERDWRLLAKKLNTDRYIAYFATKPSPTEQILNLWECRASQNSHASHTIVELLMVLKDMERQDVLDIITETIGSLWI